MNSIIFVFTISALALTSPSFATENQKPVETVAMPDPDTGDFDGDISEAEAKMREAMRRMRQDKFSANLFKTIDNGDVKQAEELLAKQVHAAPEYKSDGSYIAAKSKIAYAKGDYKTAFAEADKLIGLIEKDFAPKKPYAINFKDPNVRDGVWYSYILRYQAAAKLLRYEDSLADLNRALRLEATPELLRAKTGALIAMKKYGEAAEAANKAYALDKNVFVSSPYRDHYCWLFSENGYDVKACSYFAAKAKERAEAEKRAP